MRSKFFIGALLLLLSVSAAYAQDYLKGKVIDSGTDKGLSDVFIKNVTKNKITISEADGKFEIQGSVGNLLIFSSSGYLSDTLVVIDAQSLNIRLKVNPALLKEVNINSSKSFDPHTEYPEIYTKSKVYILSPSTIFSKEAKNARRLKKYFAQEEKEREIDRAFSIAYVSSLIPIRGNELQTFMAMYRPTYDFIQRTSGPTLAAYINDSYIRYKALTPEQRKQSSLTGQ
ncbi:hypothetical protein ACFQZS_01225 [Mucilaginibacter calamicampi]|uniref:CarboxypepD_reg-like domain-containing protein n=1 Tax=Mucilaginibacter calamicampi TaxID=1302352 RepID=A0ABW2YQY8_9SPHI